MEYERTKASKIGVGKSRKRIIAREGGDHLSSTSSASKKFPPIRISPTLLILFIQIFIATRASHTISVTRFGEILPLWQKKLKSLVRLFNIWKTFYLLWWKCFMPLGKLLLLQIAEM